MLGYGGFLLLGGRAADLLGRRRMFLVSLAVFLVASALGGLADAGPLLIATPTSSRASAPHSRRRPGSRSSRRASPRAPRATGRSSIYTATGAIGFSLGLVFGGVLTDLSWRWVFFLPVPVALLMLLAADFAGAGGSAARRFARGRSTSPARSR